MMEMLALLVLWFVLSVPFAFFLGAAMRQADEIETRYRGRQSID
jgi:hypothetical protein